VLGRRPIEDVTEAGGRRCGLGHASELWKADDDRRSRPTSTVVACRRGGTPRTAPVDGGQVVVTPHSTTRRP
jgi:hypothetical protein